MWRELSSGHKGSVCPAELVDWEVEPDLGSAIDKFGTDRAAVGLDQFLNDGQANAGAAVIA